jgi:hypothetical protein
LGALWVAAASVGACVPDFPPASQLGDAPQVLAVRAEPPEVAPGQVVRLDSLVHWPGNPPEHLWLVCVPTEVDTLDTCVSNRLGDGGVLLPPCAAAPGVPLCYASQDATALYTVPADLPLDDEGRATIFVELVVGDDLASDECVRAYRDLDPSERCLVALKRLAVSVAVASNVSPALAPLVVDGTPVDTTPVDVTAVVVLDPTGAAGDDLEVALTVGVLPETVDEFTLADEPPDEPPEEPPEEALLPMALYATCGTFDEDEPDLRCEPPAPGDTAPRCEPVTVTWKPQTSGECTLHVTLRDGRGGVAWLTQRFSIGSGT